MFNWNLPKEKHHLFQIINYVVSVLFQCCVETWVKCIMAVDGSQVVYEIIQQLTVVANQMLGHGFHGCLTPWIKFYCTKPYQHSHWTFGGNSWKQTGPWLPDIILINIWTSNMFCSLLLIHCDWLPSESSSSRLKNKKNSYWLFPDPSSLGLPYVKIFWQLLMWNSYKKNPQKLISKYFTICNQSIQCFANQKMSSLFLFS